MQIFLSVARVTTPAQKAFLEALENKLRLRGLEPRTIGRNTFTAGQPLDRIKEEMRRSKGLLVLAFERTRVASGTESPESAEPSQFAERRYATPWHHIEVALASMLGLPIFVVLEKGVFEEGLLEDKHGWYVKRTTLQPSVLDNDEFIGILDDWCTRAKASKAVKMDPSELSLGALVSGMKPAQLWGVLTTVFMLVTGAFMVGAWANSHGLLGDKKAPATITGTASPSIDNINAANTAKGLSVTERVPHPPSTLGTESENELSLARAGKTAFDDKRYEDCIVLLERAKTIQRSRVWTSKYPYLIASYFLTNHADKAREAAGDLRAALQVPNTYLSNATPRSSLLDALTEVRPFVSAEGQVVLDELIKEVRVLLP